MVGQEKVQVKAPGLHRWLQRGEGDSDDMGGDELVQQQVQEVVQQTGVLDASCREDLLRDGRGVLITHLPTRETIIL